MMKPLLIGQVARQAGVGVGAVRLYERLGLIPVPSRTASGYRCYSEDTALRVRVIQAAKMLGFTLREMAELFAQVGRGGLTGVARDAVLDDKLRDIETRIRSLHHLKTLLLRLKKTDGGATARAECVLAEAALKIVHELERHPAATSRRSRAFR